MGFPKHYATAAATAVAAPAIVGSSDVIPTNNSSSNNGNGNNNKRKFVDASPSFDPATHGVQSSGVNQHGPAATKAPRTVGRAVSFADNSCTNASTANNAAGPSAVHVHRRSLGQESRQGSYDSADGGRGEEGSNHTEESPFRIRPAVSRTTSQSSSFDKNELASAFALASLSKGVATSLASSSSSGGSFPVGASASFSNGTGGGPPPSNQNNITGTASPTLGPRAQGGVGGAGQHQGRIVPMYVDQRPDGFLVSPDSQASPASGTAREANVRTPAEAIPGLDAHMAQRQEEADQRRGGGVSLPQQARAPTVTRHGHAVAGHGGPPRPPPPAQYNPYAYPYGYYYGMPPPPPPPHAAGHPAFPPPPPGAVNPPLPPTSAAAAPGYPPHPVAPPPPHSHQVADPSCAGRKWACDYCTLSSFATYEEACAHEAVCQNKSSTQSQAGPDGVGSGGAAAGGGVLKSPGSPPRRHHVRQVSWYPSISRDDCPTSPPTGGLRRGPSTEEVRDSSEYGSSGFDDPTSSPTRKAVVEYKPQPITDEEQRRLDREEEAAREFAKSNVAVRPTPLCVVETDPTWLSDLNCYIRQNCVEAFTASDMDIHRTSKRGRISHHQVGIRCRFCTHDYEKDVIGKVREATAAISFPVSVSGIYESVKRWHRVHTKVCQGIPNETREQLRILAEKPVYVPTSRGYWTESAKALGMRDCPTGGIYFHRQPDESVKEYLEKKATDVKDGKGQYGRVAPVLTNSSAYERNIASKQIVLPSDKDDVSPYVFLLMSQVQPTTFTAADRYVARSKGPIGYAGFECKHCAGHAGLGKYFPSSAKGMCTNSTSQNMHSHLIKCRRVPQEVKDELEDLKQGGKGKCNIKLENGWRRKFFHKVWKRLHEEGES